MEIKFSDELNSVLNFSRQEAFRTGCRSIEPDHILLAVLRMESCQACRLLCALGVDTDSLKKHIDGKISEGQGVPFDQMDTITFSRSCQNLLSIAVIQAGAGTSVGECTTVHVLLALLRAGVGPGAEYLRSAWGVEYDSAAKMASGLFPDVTSASGAAPQTGGKAVFQMRAEGVEDEVDLEDFGVNLTAEAAKGRLDPVYGRGEHMDSLVRVLGRRRKNSALLVGEAGVGKSAIVEGLAARIAGGNVPSSMRGKEIYMLDIASVVAGTKFRGEFEKRLKNIINAISARTDIILYIDEFHTIVGAGKSEGGLDAANILKPALARGLIQCIGATTPDEYTRYIEKDGALARRFQKIQVEKTDIAQTIEILKVLRPRYEEYHSVVYPDQTLESCVRLSERYINGKCLPDKAVDVMDEAGSERRILSGGKAVKVGVDDIAAVISKITRVPVGKIAQSEAQRLVGMAERLKESVIGQDDAVERVSKAICRSRAGIKDPNRPIGSFLFMGPTGVGKTLLAKSLAECLFDSPDNMVRIDMSEYMEKFAVTRLIGAPPGYVGFDDNGQLTEPVRQKPYCVVLLDEIEKAHPDIFNLLLQVMDEGRLTDSHGRTVSFKNTILIMTSNVGSRDVAQRGQAAGFSSYDPADAARNTARFSSAIVQRALERTFPPEFLGRLDDRVEFNFLSRGDVDRIIDIELDKIRSRVHQNGYTLRVSKATARQLAARGYDTRFGARPLKRAILELVENPVSEKLILSRLTGKEEKIITV